ncbi:MAG: hypothetical protein IJG13_14355, partial [Kiritimatiellae bacterium]|nr:hypothetical protein [Kiritimatiellia bacterium]
MEIAGYKPRVVLSSLVMTAFSVGTASGATGDWLLRAGIGETAESPAVWSDAGNWHEGAVPSATGDGAYLTNALSAPLYVKAAGGFSISWLQGVAGAITDTAVCPYVISDSGVTLNSSSRNPFLSGIRLYADLSVPNAAGNAHFNSCFLCGDVSMNFMSVSSGTVYHRLDLYAKAAGETRANPLSISTYRNSWGAFRVYAPQGSPTNVVGRWTRKAGSAYISRTGGNHVISAGTLVHGTGITEGTFVRRIFSDELVELSDLATADVDDGELTFDAFTPNVTIKAIDIARQNGSTDNIRLMKYREEDSLRCEVKNIYGGASNICVFDTDAGFVPGTYVVKRIVNSAMPHLRFGDCHFEFAAADAGESGFPEACFKVIGSDDRVRLTVQDGVTARILGITNLVGTVVKDGAGTLKTSLNVQPSLNTGVLEVRGGVLELEGEIGGGAAYVKTLAVSNGATLKLPPNGLKVDSLVYEEGAVLSGEGAIYLPALASLEGLTFSDGASVGVIGGAGEVIAEIPEYRVVGTPAFWVDVSDEDSRTIVAENGTNFVTRLNDVRGVEYGFATNVVKRPWLVTDSSGQQHIYFAQSNDAGIENARPLVWDKFVYGIRHVFLVHSPASGGGEVLGVSDMLWKKHYQSCFLRDASNTWNSDIVWGGGMYDVVNGRFCVNGEERAYNAGYPYSGTYTYSKDTYYIPLVLEAAPLSGVHADCFGYDGSRYDRNGRMRLYECIVYTNVLTRAERLAVTGYLMKKWMNAEVNFTCGSETNSFGVASLSPGAPGYAVASGETGWIDSVSGSGTLTKRGGGTLTVAELSDADADLCVEDGTLAVASRRMTADSLPDGAYLHVDASADETLTKTEADGVVRVTAWASVNEGGQTLNAIAASTNKAVYAATACNGKPAVDFGPRRNVYAEGVSDANPDLRFGSGKAKKATFHTALMLMDSSQGGGSIVPNCGYGYNDGYGLIRYNYGQRTATEDALIWNSGRPGNQTDNGVGTGVTRARVNGAFVAAKSAGLSGGWDVVSLANHYAFGASGLGSDHYGYYIGGSKIAEYILYPQMLSRQTVEAVEAYLREKWLGVETPGYRATRAKSVAVASGATLDLRGGSVATAALSGGGSVAGAVALDDGAVMTFHVEENGSIAALDVSGVLSAAGSGTARFTGSVKRLASG